MKFGIPKEAGVSADRPETRVALVPDVAKALIKKGHEVFVQAGAGTLSFISDKEYQDAGCQIASDLKALYQSCECVLRISPPTLADIENMPEGKSLISYLWALRNPKLVDALKARKITSFSMDAIPRISRAQSMDALSSMSTVAGYKAVLLAAAHLARFLPMLTTAAGTIKPSQGLIIGAGVAGLQAIATAKRLGAVVEAFDTRPAVKEQIQSLGAQFVELPQTEEDKKAAEDKGGYAKEKSEAFLELERKILGPRVKAADFVITTALIPGKPAPKLITTQMVKDMRPGSVIIDLAAEAGGNCEYSKPETVVVENGVTILAPLNLAATMPLDASRMYARNISTLIQHIVNEKGFTWDWNDEIFSETCITHDGQIKSKRLIA